MVLSCIGGRSHFRGGLGVVGLNLSFGLTNFKLHLYNRLLIEGRKSDGFGL